MQKIKLTMALATLILSTSCALYHHYPSYYGKIVDAETKKPLEGAVVLADYYTWLHASPGGPGVYFLDAQEAISDKNGEFRIPALNAFAFRPISTFEPEPGFSIFKPRYSCFQSRLAGEQYRTIELREAKNRDERIWNTNCYPTIVPDDKMKKFIDVINSERIAVGLEPGHLEEKSK
jgi:hypothetical protein